MSDVCVKQHASLHNSSHPNLYDKSLTPTPKDCLYFPAEHQHTRHQHMFDEAHSSLHYREDRQRDVYAEAPLEAPGPFRVAVAASSSSTLRERNYEIPFLVSSKVSTLLPLTLESCPVITCLSCLIALFSVPPVYPSISSGPHRRQRAAIDFSINPPHQQSMRPRTPIRVRCTIPVSCLISGPISWSPAPALIVAPVTNSLSSAAHSQKPCPANRQKAGHFVRREGERGPASLVQQRNCGQGEQ